MRIRVLVAAFGVAVLACGSAQAQVPNPPEPGREAARISDFSLWVRGFKPQAVAGGVRPEVYDQAMAYAHLDQSVLDAASNQPEFSKPVWEYLDRAVSPTRISTGQQKISENRQLLSAIQTRYGVDYHVLVAIWGLESAYGGYMGNHNVLAALATLGYEGRRQSFGREQLIAALKIIQNGDIAAAEMEGSWAGAMGQTQFIPTTYNAYAVDFEGDGKRDIWHSKGDALGSAANYLRASGWQSGMPWGFEVSLPVGFDYASADLSVKKPVGAWAVEGVRSATGGPLPHHLSGQSASIILPVGAQGPAFMVLKNFNTIMRYNNSTSYALAISLLSERFQGKGEIVKPWPKIGRPLSRSERYELQRRLTAAGFSTDGVDGKIGPATRNAVRAYQAAQGLTPDGFPTLALLERLRAG